MDDPYASPASAAPASRNLIVAFGIVTLAYASLASCCGIAALPAQLSGADPAANAIDQGLLVVCTVLYVAGFAPGLAGVLRSPWTRQLHLGWAGALIGVEVLASLSYALSHPNGWVTGLVSIAMFCGWPAVCLVALPFVRPR